MPVPAQRFPRVPPFPQGLELLAHISEAQFEVLRTEIAKPEGFFRGLSRCRRLSKMLGTGSPAEIASLLGTLEFLYDRAQLWSEENGDRKVFLRDFLVSTETWSTLGTEPEANFERLLDLIEPNPDIDRERKRTWLRTGIMSSAESFASFVDLRANFDAERTNIEELLPIILFSVQMETEDGSSQQFVFQTTEAGLLELNKTVEDARRKVRSLKNALRKSGLVVLDDEEISGEK